MKRLLAALGAFATLSCSGGGGEGVNDEVAPTVFVAFAKHFGDFRDWPSFDVTKDAAPGTVHPDARLIEYVSEIPPSGSREFPIGTMIVKEGTDGDPYERQFFAMAKRGGGYNKNGADGWEWFELQNLERGGVQIVWRGVGPPAGEVYGGDPNAGCNTCHRDCGNDAVCAPKVQLSDF